MQSPDRSELWCPGQSLWSLIAEHVAWSELPKIHSALGNSLVNMYTEVHSEAEMWHKMWQESHQGHNISRAGTPLPHQQGSALADPPAVKELVRAEVKMLLQNLRERASRVEKDGEEVVFQYKPETVDYALRHPGSCYRNCTSPEDTDNGSRPSSCCSVRSKAEVEIEAMRDKLTVTNIDQVVDRLKSILTEECESLNRLVKHLKGNIKQRCLNKCDKSEPTLAELRELRQAIQMDLELYPSSSAASLPASFAVPLKELKNGPRLSAGQRFSEEALQDISCTSVLRPHPPPPLCHAKPKPLFRTPPTKTSASVRLINSSSLSLTHGQHRNTSVSTGPKKTQSLMATSSGHANSHFSTSPPGPASDQIMIKTTHNCSLSPEQNSDGLHRRIPPLSASCQIKSPQISTIHEPHPSAHRRIHIPSRGCDLSPQTERKSNPAWRSRNINTIPSLIPAVSPHCDADSYSSSSTDHSTGKSDSKNSICGGGLASATVQAHNDRRKGTSEGFPACAGSRKSNTGFDRNKTGHHGKDVTQQQSLLATV
uniref:coiled-coil domain-containing protein 24 n=1 Tax=Scatophagus argus TaxID=75038 RepID=UPI001ED7FB40|nr:coiled-coil domain-containing protein 24 [Scatophagus argus]